jgi:lysozyme family protein
MGVDRFYDIIQITLKNEGGYVHNPHDPGGETNFGISKRSYPNVDIKNLTKDKAITIYKRDFWDNQSYQYINDHDLAAKAFDMAVNMGPSQANKLLQRAVGTLSADGVLGKLSLAAINNFDPEKLLSYFKDQLTGFYQSLVAKHPSNKQFLNGWLKRVNQ